MNITEKHIEKFVQYPNLLSETERKYIKKAIDGSAELKKLAEWFEKYYRDFDELQSPIPHLITLTPTDHSYTNSQSGDNLILAAKSGPDTRKVTVETLATFESEENQIIVRLLRNNASGKYQFHLIRDQDPKKDELNILTLGNRDIDFVIDESRHISFEPESNWQNVNWNQVAVELRRPVEKFELSKNDSAIPEVDEVSFQFNYDGSLKLQKTRKVNSISRIVTRGKDSDYKIYRFNSSGSLELSVSGLHPVKIWFFE